MKNIRIDPEQMKALFRYETTFETYLYENGLLTGKPVFDTGYTATLEDLTAAFENIAEKNPTLKVLNTFWLARICEYDDAFGICSACCGRQDESLTEDTEKDILLFPHLPNNDGEIFSDVWYSLCGICSAYDEECCVIDLPVFRDLLEHLLLYRKEKHLPDSKRTWPEHLKKKYIDAFSEESVVKSATEEQLALCRRFTEESCERDEIAGLRLKGYSCYGGNRLYECDWYAARDCMLRLYEKTDDPQYANTLGYIYYYGRCTDGEPEYEKAMRMFMVSAANGLHEGIYKLADMFNYGHACKKSPATAAGLYSMVYSSCLEQLDEDDTGSFSDAALRMGNLFMHGINTRRDTEKALYFYTQALWAAKIRAEQNDFFGNMTVLHAAEKAVREARASLPESYIQEYLTHSRPELLSLLCGHGNSVSLTVSKRKNSLLLKAVRLPKTDEDDPEKVLITLPQLEFCGMTDTVCYTVYGATASFTRLTYDWVEWYGEEAVFYCCGKETGRITGNDFRVYREKKKNTRGKKVRLVSVCFVPGGKTYDYLCPLRGVKPGDTVLVNGYDGTAEVTVTDVYERFESELSLPLVSYKKVIGKG